MIKILTLVDSFKHFETAIQEYEKRLGKECEIIKLKPEKNGSDSQIIEKETDLLIKKLEKENGLKIVLNPNGKNFSTEEFYDFIENQKTNHKNIIFVIGGALGIDYKKLKNHVDYEINLGKMVLPHSLAILVLIEQIYRVSMIKKGTSYHK
ncbi:MAG: 23S rRNA (pseudouridine(1915)-N(3))-methyltransferase RlmH [Candidatus Gracilibacteria bacterium]|nr:23S rRNA (pseudouridine(1915)-N(3))-methyltransferase RlmH [Candidatus Gracilibacteria bacterium]